MSKYTEKDAARDTSAGSKETSRTWHQAREDSRASSGWTDISDRPATNPGPNATREPTGSSMATALGPVDRARGKGGK